MNIENETNVEKNAVLSVSERRRDYVGTAAVCVNSLPERRKSEKVQLLPKYRYCKNTVSNAFQILSVNIH